MTIWLFYEPEPGLIDQCSSLQRMITAFTAHMSRGSPAQFGIDTGDKPRLDIAVAMTQLKQQSRNRFAGKGFAGQQRSSRSFVSVVSNILTRNG